LTSTTSLRSCRTAATGSVNAGLVMTAVDDHLTALRDAIAGIFILTYNSLAMSRECVENVRPCAAHQGTRFKSPVTSPPRLH
jgi:hypothetical protein